MEMTISNLWDILVPTITGAVTAVISWLTTRRKYEGELAAARAALEDSQIDNLNKAMASYDTLMERYSRQIEELVAENDKLRSQSAGNADKIDEILSENRQLRKEVEALKERVAELTAVIEKGKPYNNDHIKI